MTGPSCAHGARCTRPGARGAPAPRRYFLAPKAQLVQELEAEAKETESDLGQLSQQKQHTLNTIEVGAARGLAGVCGAQQCSSGAPCLHHWNRDSALPIGTSVGQACGNAGAWGRTPRLWSCLCLLQQLGWPTPRMHSVRAAAHAAPPCAVLQAAKKEYAELVGAVMGQQKAIAS